MKSFRNIKRMKEILHDVGSLLFLYIMKGEQKHEQNRCNKVFQNGEAIR